MNRIVTEADRKVFWEEFAGKLPAKIFDAHVHLALKSSYPEDYVLPHAYVKKFDGYFTLQDFLDSSAELLPGVEMSLAGFGFPAMIVDRSDASSFGVDNRRVFGLRLLSAYDNVEEVEKDIDKFHLTGVKPYLNMAFKRENQEVELLDFFSKEQLKMLNRRKLITVVHIPRKMRLEDPLNRQQMAYLCETYPDVTFIYAHIGRAYYRRCAVNYVDEFVKYENAFFDTAMINSESVLKYTFDHFPNERILFGSDAPIAYIHGKSIEINHQYAYITSEKMGEGTCIFDDSGKITYVPFLYEQLRSVLELGLSQQVQDDFFYNNAFRLFEATAKRNFGK